MQSASGSCALLTPWCHGCVCVCCWPAGDNPENDAARIEQLLRLGAHAIMQGGEEGAAGGGGEAAGEDKGFAAEDIEQVRGDTRDAREVPTWQLWWRSASRWRGRTLAACMLAARLHLALHVWIL